MLTYTIAYFGADGWGVGDVVHGKLGACCVACVEPISGTTVVQVHAHNGNKREAGITIYGITHHVKPGKDATIDSAVDTVTITS